MFPLETEYNAVRVINYTILRGLSSFSVRIILFCESLLFFQNKARIADSL